MCVLILISSPQPADTFFAHMSFQDINSIVYCLWNEACSFTKDWHSSSTRPFGKDFRPDVVPDLTQAGIQDTVCQK